MNVLWDLNFLNVYLISSIFQLQRRVCTEDIRVTTYAIKWDDQNQLTGDEIEEDTDVVEFKGLDVNDETIDFDNLDDDTDDIMAELDKDDEEESGSESEQLASGLNFIKSNKY